MLKHFSIGLLREIELFRSDVMTKSLFLSAASLIAGLTVSAVGQRPATPATQPRPTPVPSAAGSTAVQVPTSKMAIIYSEAFLDPKSGIAKFNSTFNKLNAEFQKPKDELTQMQQRGQALEDEINKLRQAPAGTPIDQRAVAAKIDQLEQLKKDIQRKSEDSQAAYNRRQRELFTPLEEEVGRALEAFAKARGISAIIDRSRVPLVYVAEGMDVTQAFINEFNSKNPATAITTP